LCCSLLFFLFLFSAHSCSRALGTCLEFTRVCFPSLALFSIPSSSSFFVSSLYFLALSLSLSPPHTHTPHTHTPHTHIHSHMQGEYHTELIHLRQDQLTVYNMPHTKKASLISTLENPVKILTWLVCRRTPSQRRMV